MSKILSEETIDQTPQTAQPLELRVCYSNCFYGNGSEDNDVLIKSSYLSAERQSFMALARSAEVGIEVRLVDYTTGFCKMKQWIDGWHITFNSGISSPKIVDYLRKVLARSLLKENRSLRIDRIRLPAGKLYEDIQTREPLLSSIVTITDFAEYDKELHSHSL